MHSADLRFRPGSTVRLLALLAVAHATFAFYLWFCAYDVLLPSTSLRFWQIVAWLCLLWPLLPAIRAAASAARSVPRTPRTESTKNAFTAPAKHCPRAHGIA